MSAPLRKEQPEEGLTTAALAQSKRPPASEELRPQPVLSEPITMERAESASRSEMEGAESGTFGGQNQAGATPLFPNSELEELRNRWNSVQPTAVDLATLLL